MKVLFVTHRYPPRTGGVETHVREIATRLVDRGHDVTVFSADAGGSVPSRSTDDGVHVRRFRSLSPNGAFYFAPQMALAVRRFDADVVHAHNYHAFPLFFAALGVTNARFVVTTHYHGESASGFRDSLLSFYRPFGKWAVRRADEVIAVSEWERERLSEDLNVSATVVPNGVDTERFVDAQPPNRESSYLLCVGRLEAYKGVQHVIQALPELPDHELLVAGAGPASRMLEQKARDVGVASRVHLLGYVDDDDLPGLYAGADAYISLSEFEAYGMTVAEAMATGTPCVVRRTGALQDFAGENGVFSVDDVDPKSIASVIRSAIDTDSSTTSVTDWTTVVDEIETRYTES